MRGGRGLVLGIWLEDGGDRNFQSLDASCISVVDRYDRASALYSHVGIRHRNAVPVPVCVQTVRNVCSDLLQNLRFLRLAELQTRINYAVSQAGFDRIL